MRIKTRLLVAAAVLAPFLAVPAAAAPPDCGTTTIEATIVKGDDGILVCGPGRPIILREELGKAEAGRASRRVPIKTFFSIADLQLADEESPVRGEWLDKCGMTPFGSGGYRPHESMVTHMINGHVRAANRIALNGGPVLKTPFEFAAALGDLADNQQFNETRWFIDIFDGSKLINPDSGKSADPEVDMGTDDYAGPDDYDGVETSSYGTPGTSPSLPSPVANDYLPPGMPNTLLNLANEPFWVEGFRRPDGSHLPWYTVMGNHDVKVNGSIPDDNVAWRQSMRAVVVGNAKIKEPLSPAQQQAACDGASDPDNMQNLFTALLTNPGLTKPVPSDSDRRLLEKIEWINEHATTTGSPAGHGFLPETQRCPVGPAPTALSAFDANLFRRACYSWFQEPFHFIVLDTNPLEGLENGNIDDVQFKWLEEQLKSSSKSYFDAAGKKIENPAATDHLIVVLGHHPIVSIDNPGYPWNEQIGPPQPLPGIHMKEDLEKLLLRFPNVILLNAGHTHQNKVWAHQDPDRGTGFWEINTSAVADIPTHSRTIEIADNLDGTISIFSVVFDARGAANPRTIDWTADDPSAEVAVAAARNINEEWLASAGREVLFNDPQQDLTKVGAPEDWNVELMIGVPFPLPSGGRPKSLATTGSANFYPAGQFIIGAALMLFLGTALLSRRNVKHPVAVDHPRASQRQHPR